MLSGLGRVHGIAGIHDLPWHGDLEGVGLGHGVSCEAGVLNVGHRLDHVGREVTKGKGVQLSMGLVMGAGSSHTVGDWVRRVGGDWGTWLGGF